MSEVSALRLNALRVVYSLNFVGLGFMVWPEIINHRGLWDPMYGVAYSFWAGLSLLAGLGIRFPLKMLPLLFLQLVYKLIWLTAVALPLWFAGQTPGLTQIFVIPVIIDLIVIPWPYVFATYVKSSSLRSTAEAHTG